MAAFVPYCGTPPGPGSLHWTHAPVLTGILAAVPIALALLPIRPTRNRMLAFGGGWLVVALCYLTPLCNLGVALFAARATQHVLLTLLAAPLLAASLPRGGGSAARLSIANVVFMAVIWFWHSPAFYDSTLQNNFAYWAMNGTMVAAAIWAWREIFDADGLQALAGVSFAGLQMCALGALIAFASHPFYSVHFGTTVAWDLTQLQDQHLGGLIMWVPGSLLVASYSTAALWLWLTRLGEARSAASRLALPPAQ